VVNAPLLLVANYAHQLFINVSTAYGGVSGAGWFTQGSTDTLTVLNPVENLSGNERYAFVSWSNGSRQQNLSIVVSKPISIRALFADEYKVSIIGRNQEGNPIAVAYYLYNNTKINSTSYIESGNYKISGAFYKGTEMNLNYSFSVSGPETLNITLPVYGVNISTRDIFGFPVNATLLIRFENGTSIQSYSGPLGTLHIENVPYGFASGSAYYLFKENFSTEDGRQVSLVFVSPSSLLVVIVLVLVFILLLVWIRKERNMKQTSEKE
ncbi:MAG: hypothetical protein QXT43_02015, partial [Candidatus Micrarchaeaceae archaeon]